MRPRQCVLTARAAPLLILLLLIAAAPAITTARSPEAVLDARPAIERGDARSASRPGGRYREFYGWWHDAGQLLLHKSNFGFIGDWGSAEGEPSAEWPAGSGYEHLYAAGLWVGAIAGTDTLVTAAVYGIEFLAPMEDPVYTIYESAFGAPGGTPGFDDDSDGLTDEDRLDGIDNDLDTLIDEDYAAFSDEMFACAYFDTIPVENHPPGDPHVSLSLEVYETSYAWSAPRIDDFVRIRYEVKNIGDAVLDDVYLGFMVDPDVGPGEADQFYVDDRVAFIDKEVPEVPVQEHVRLQMAYCYDEPGGLDGDWDGHVGFLVLDHPTDPDGIIAPPTVGPLAYRSWHAGPDDPGSDPERYRYMSEPVISPPAATAQDWRFVLSVGPFDELAPGETTFLEVAVVCGQGLRGLVENASALASRLEDASALTRLDGPESVAADSDDLTVTRFHLAPPHPNPASTEATIAFSLPRREHVELSVLTCTGRLVATLIDGERAPGEHSATWDGRTRSGEQASSGIYIARLTAGGREALRKMVLVR
jgi:hypothetical protein